MGKTFRFHYPGQTALALLQLDFQLLHGQVGIDPCQDLLVLKRLGDVVDGTKLQPFYLIHRIRKGRHEDHRDRCCFLMFLEPSTDLEAVDVGHDIQNVFEQCRQIEKGLLPLHHWRGSFTNS